MKTRRWLVRLLEVALCLFPLSGFAASLDLKTGSWEVMMATTVTGVPIPQDALAKMPPDQHAKFEEAMKARAGKVNTSTMHTCVTKEDLDRGDLMKSERENCTRKVIDQSARRFEVEESCAAPEPSQTHMTFDSKSPDAYNAIIERSQGEGGKVHIELNGHWVEAKCAADDED
jgi:hypothetical protein